MDRLWAPWRINYVAAKKKKGCLFCSSLKKKNAREIIFKTRHSFVILNIFPYNNGHLMIVPVRHTSSMRILNDSEVMDLFRTLKTATSLLDKVLKPDGYNIGLNLSREAGAGITRHLHIHLVPRWNGDTNFMPVVSNTKIISQSLEELAKKLKNAYAKQD
jgi:ATP adenylyltransferase